MSTEYYVYTEVNIGGKWIGVDPMLPKMIDKRDDYHKPHQYDGSYDMKRNCTYWNGSRSYFGNAYDKLRDIGSEIKYAELSDEVKEDWQHALKEEEAGEDIDSWFPAPKPICVDYNTFKNNVDKNSFDYHGLVHKDQLFMYENGDLEDLYCAEHEEFTELTPEERQCYVYHEWDESMGWNRYFKILLDRVSERIYDFEDINGFNWDNNNFQYRIVVITS